MQTEESFHLTPFDRLFMYFSETVFPLPTTSSSSPLSFFFSAEERNGGTQNTRRIHHIKFTSMEERLPHRHTTHSKANALLSNLSNHRSVHILSISSNGTQEVSRYHNKICLWQREASFCQ